jgi:hypothetical protein
VKNLIRWSLPFAVFKKIVKFLDLSREGTVGVMPRKSREGTVAVMPRKKIVGDGGSAAQKRALGHCRSVVQRRAPPISAAAHFPSTEAMRKFEKENPQKKKHFSCSDPTKQS